MNFRWLFLVTSSSTSLKLLPFFEVEPVSFMFENPNQENGGTEDQKKEKKGTKDLGVAVFVLIENLSNNHKRTNRKDKNSERRKRKDFLKNKKKKLL